METLFQSNEWSNNHFLRLARSGEIQYIAGMETRSYRVKIAGIRPLTAEVHELALKVMEPPSLTFRPGQSIAITIPSPSSHQAVRRYYSVSSPPSVRDHISLVFNGGEQGVGTQFLRNQVLGQELMVEGPFGSFYLQDDPDQKLLFVATGTGIAPIRSMIATVLENGRTQPMTLLWGLRCEADIYFLEELEAWSSRFPQFSYILTLSQPGTQWRGERGRVTRILETMENVDECAVYVCGGRKMVAEVIALLHQRGVSRIYRERFHDDP